MTIIYVALGGAIGATLRYGLKLLIPSIWGTAVINIIGCFALGFCMMLMQKSSPLFLLIGVGLLGGFTTFSTFATDSLLTGEKIQIAYILASVFGGLAACYAGIWLGKIYA